MWGSAREPRASPAVSTHGATTFGRQRAPPGGERDLLVSQHGHSSRRARRRHDYVQGYGPAETGWSTPAAKRPKRKASSGAPPSRMSAAASLPSASILNPWLESRIA